MGEYHTPMMGHEVHVWTVNNIPDLIASNPASISKAKKILEKEDRHRFRENQPFNHFLAFHENQEGEISVHSLSRLLKDGPTKKGERKISRISEEYIQESIGNYIDNYLHGKDLEDQLVGYESPYYIFFHTWMHRRVMKELTNGRRVDSEEKPYLILHER